ncbi:MAG: pyridoxal-dependent decarboxylase [Polyangiaceae bacterium]|nr:pyridoxal-dependent decarboxylase [Polyangiaceae bacterium]
MISQWVKPVLRPLARMYWPRRVDLPLSTWRLTRTAGGVLAWDGVPLDTLLDRWGSPLHVVDATRLSQNAAEFLAVPEGAEKGCEIFYSFKTNPVPGVLHYLKSCGVGAEVISAFELWLALKLGFEPNSIVYDGPAKSPESLRVAVERGVGLINLNSRCEIAPLAAICREVGRRARVGVRIVPIGAWGGQMGERVDSGAALRAFTEALECPELDVVALHAHRGGQMSSAEEVRSFVSGVLAFAGELGQRLSLDLEVLDFGGSLACPTTHHLDPKEALRNRRLTVDLVPRPPQATLSIRGATTLIVSMAEAHYREAGRPRPRIFLEPGRAMTSNTQMLLTRVMNIHDASGGLRHAVLDAGFCVAGPVQTEYHQLFPVGPSRRGGKKQMYRLTGPICSPADILYAAWELPELAVGDALAIMDSGAYFVPFASSFSFPQPGIAMVDGGQARLLRRGETFEDITALDEMGDSAPDAVASKTH